MLFSKRSFFFRFAFSRNQSSHAGIFYMTNYILGTTCNFIYSKPQASWSEPQTFKMLILSPLLLITAAGFSSAFRISRSALATPALSSPRFSRFSALYSNNGQGQDETDGRGIPTDAPVPPPAPSQFDLKASLDTSGPGFNQFDPVLFLTRTVSRRFGLGGGLAIVGLLAATEGREIVNSLLNRGPTPGSGEVITLPRSYLILSRRLLFLLALVCRSNLKNRSADRLSDCSSTQFISVAF